MFLCMCSSTFLITTADQKMIRRKEGQCIDCPPGSPPRPLTAGRCSFHYWPHRNKISQGKRNNSEEAKERKSKLSYWFEYHNRVCSFICENCGAIIIPKSHIELSSCQAHIVPKEHFLSVMGVLDNHMLLGGMFQKCKCHQDYDSNWKRAQGMKVFTLATERFLKFKHLILPEEIKFLPPVFSDLI